jgi:hypothetical protein
VGLWLIGSLGCIREQLPEICPNADYGEIVISELRGPQDGDETICLGRRRVVFAAKSIKFDYK